MPDIVQCPGCHLPVDIARPPDIAFQVRRGQNDPGTRTSSWSTSGSSPCTAARCCADGEWR